MWLEEKRYDKFPTKDKVKKCCGYVSSYERTAKKGSVVIHTIFSTHVETVCLIERVR
jgi:hypothetical protein